MVLAPSPRRRVLLGVSPTKINKRVATATILLLFPSSSLVFEVVSAVVGIRRRVLSTRIFNNRKIGKSTARNSPQKTVHIFICSHLSCCYMLVWVPVQSFVLKANSSPTNCFQLSCVCWITSTAKSRGCASPLKAKSLGGLPSGIL